MLIKAAFQVCTLLYMVASVVARPPPPSDFLRLPKEHRHAAIRRKHNTTTYSFFLSSFASPATLAPDATSTYSSASKVPSITVIPTQSSQNTTKITSTASLTPSTPSASKAASSPTSIPSTPTWTNSTNPSPLSPPATITITLKDEQNLEYPVEIPTTNRWTSTNVIQSITHLSISATNDIVCFLIGIDGLAIVLTSQTPTDLVVAPPQTIVGGLCGVVPGGAAAPPYGPYHGGAAPNGTSCAVSPVSAMPSGSSVPDHWTGDDGSAANTPSITVPNTLSMDLFALLSHVSNANVV